MLKIRMTLREIQKISFHFTENSKLMQIRQNMTVVELGEGFQSSNSPQPENYIENSHSRGEF